MSKSALSTKKAEYSARLERSPARVWLLIIVLGGLGALLWSLVFSLGIKGGGGQFVIMLVGAGAFYQAIRLYQHRYGAIRLCADRLEDEEGRLICMISNIDHVELGMFALKPSHGFALRLKTRMKWGGNLGLWWRFGRRVGIGGLSGRDAGKAFAKELLRAQAERGDEDGEAGCVKKAADE